MNKVEKLVYDTLKSKPWLKLWARNIYQALFDLLPTPKEYSVNRIEIKEGYFFGFHDITPFSENNAKILANKLYFDLRMPIGGDLLGVGYFDFVDGCFSNYHLIGETDMWNFHKGCRLQWVDRDRLIYNCTSPVTGRLAARIYNIDSNEERYISWPIDSVSKDGKLATSFSYGRLEKFMPGYGYNDFYEEGTVEERAPENTGLFIINLDNNRAELAISIKQLASDSRKEEASETSYHYVTHSEFSPDGRFVSFFHRWTGDDTRKRYTRLIIYSPGEKKYFVVRTGYMVSHYVWNNKNQIIAYCNFNNKDSHVLLNIPELGQSRAIGYPVLNSDGHQSFITDTSFVTDTYPDRRRMAKLYAVNTDSGDVKLLARVFSPKKFQTKSPLKHIACDLHPRVSSDGKYICFDTVKSDKRSLAVMQMPEIL